MDFCYLLYFLISVIPVLYNILYSGCVGCKTSVESLQAHEITFSLTLTGCCEFLSLSLL